MEMNDMADQTCIGFLSSGSTHLELQSRKRPYARPLEPAHDVRVPPEVLGEEGVLVAKISATSTSGTKVVDCLGNIRAMLHNVDKNLALASIKTDGIGNKPNRPRSLTVVYTA
ncbi:hypothetical protein EUGRSUZ_E00202 [Eucalyptus grandis]|uniref:Uncharacterized protein n=2 Tax=Eucalyptus grandis TaxID=71139 RepID=A0ACC3KR12_EUCGR|nr:hypothetical protein EUGRSUZ_E00202 [Eucalyptus grandis]